MDSASSNRLPLPGLQAAGARDWVRIGLWLVVATMAYNAVEGGVALWAGARADSIALLGFGLDSFIECTAAAVLLWRLAAERRGADPETIETSERKVHRFVGGTFLVLAFYVLVQGSWTLWHRDPPEESIIGILLAAVSLVVMPLVSWGKLHAAKAINSAALRSEAKETLACSYLSFTLLLGLVANAVAGWWWADPLAALLMTPWLVKEGMEGLRGEHCETAHQ
ncbi:MAG: cation transporter [Nitrospinae bacterium]|nr:cation transporter [Nitrospinota bacterium]